jgi:hypothetical protein
VTHRVRFTRPTPAAELLEVANDDGQVERGRGFFAQRLTLKAGFELQSAPQPSPGTALPSSHSSLSDASRMPSPQLDAQDPTGVVAVPHLGSSAQLGEQPSNGCRLPSSHCSEPSFF